MYNIDIDNVLNQQFYHFKYHMVFGQYVCERDAKSSHKHK